MFPALLTLCALSSASAESLPGLPLPFSTNDAGQWVLSDGLPQAYADAGVEPGWILKAVDGRAFTSGLSVRRQVARGPAREVQLLFQTTEEEGPPEEVETILVVPRGELIQIEELGLLPYPDGFAPDASGWKETRSGVPLLIDALGASWLLDAQTGAQERADIEVLGDRQIPEVWWTLNKGIWIIDDADGLIVGGVDNAKEAMDGAIRIRSFQSRSGDHLVKPGPEGLQVFTVSWPRGTPDLPTCEPAVPETCLASGRQLYAELGERPGGRDEALRQLGLACANGVYRGCLEAVAIEDTVLSEQALSCIDGDVNACHTVSRERLSQEPDDPGLLVQGVLEFSCQMDASGSLGERLRRLEDVGDGCVMLAEAYDALNQKDRALLSLDQACVLGRADACEEAEQRRKKAFALRTVRECEDPALPVASACVELGQILQNEPVSATSLDDFNAFLRGCNLGDEDGCRLLGDYVDRWGIENPRVIQAEEELLLSCTNGVQRACLGSAYLMVRHEPRSDAYARALELFSGACEAGIASGCVAGAEQRRIGKAKKVDAPDQLDMWRSACERLSAPGCAGLGLQLSEDKKAWAEAFTAYDRACEFGDAHACTLQGLLTENKHKAPWPDEQPTDAYLKKGCDNGDPEGCFELAEDDLPKKGEPPEDAYLLLERSCLGEFGEGCAALAKVHLDRKTNFDLEIAAGHLDTACNNGSFESCRELALMYQRGRGVEKDRAMARELAQRFQLNAPRRHIRIGADLGFPYAAGGDAEIVLPIPVGPAISVGGTYSYTPFIGTALVFLKGDSSPDTNPALAYWDVVARLYPNNKARGLFVGVGYHDLQTVGGDTPTLTRTGYSARIGIHSDNKLFYTRAELGLAQYGIIRLSDFDEDETGSFPLIQPVLGFSVGLAFL
ncbi:MAG: tetratricopeptide repeat protein [Myxococcota bacterium]